MCILLILVVLSIKFTATSALAWGGAYPEKWADPKTGAFSWDLYCSDPENAKTTCCGKSGGSKCWCGCSVKYCTYDKNGKNGKCNGYAEAPKYELLGGGGYIGNCAKACSTYAQFPIDKYGPTPWCTGQGWGAPYDDYWGDMREYCRGIGWGCVDWQGSFLAKNNLKFCFTDADWKNVHYLKPYLIINVITQYPHTFLNKIQKSCLAKLFLLVIIILVRKCMVVD